MPTAAQEDGKTPDNWEEIATAPTDGRDLLGLVLPGGRQLVIRWTDYPVAGWVTAHGDLVTPTHWQELPALPKKGT